MYIYMFFLVACICLKAKNKCFQNRNPQFNLQGLPQLLEVQGPEQGGGEGSEGVDDQEPLGTNEGWPAACYG